MVLFKRIASWVIILCLGLTVVWGINVGAAHLARSKAHPEKSSMFEATSQSILKEYVRLCEREYGDKLVEPGLVRGKADAIAAKWGLQLREVRLSRSLKVELASELEPEVSILTITYTDGTTYEVGIGLTRRVT